MKERPILFKADMVRALLDGRKTMTRRIVKLDGIPQVNSTLHSAVQRVERDGDKWDFLVPAGTAAFIPCPYGVPGDRLWVRETWCQRWTDEPPWWDGYWYQASNPEVVKVDDDGAQAYRKDGTEASPWKPAIHMPRTASRITLEVTGVRVERVQEITCEDVYAEGLNVSLDGPDGAPCYIEDFSMLWNQINGPGAWERNDWVWVVEFRRAQ